MSTPEETAAQRLGRRVRQARRRAAAQHRADHRRRVANTPGTHELDLDALAAAEDLAEQRVRGRDRASGPNARPADDLQRSAAAAVDTIENIIHVNASRNPIAAAASAGIRERRRRQKAAADASAIPPRVSEQTFLLRNLDLLSRARAQTSVNRITRVLTKEPGSILNRMNLRPKVGPLFDIRPYQIAALVPKIRLYKLFLDEAGEGDKLVELKFNDHTTKESIDSITDTRFGRGDGVGIQSFTIETQGTNPAEGALVRCTLKIFFQNLETLASPSGNRHNDYLELILRRTKYQHSPGEPLPERPPQLDSSGHPIHPSREINKNYFKLLASVGWALPKGSLGTNDKVLKEALRSCSQTIFLSLYEHNIDFNQDGTAVLTAEYQGALEQMLSSDSYDILSLGQEHPLQLRLDAMQKALDRETAKGKDIRENPSTHGAAAAAGSPQLKAINKAIVHHKKRINKLQPRIRAQKYKTLIEKLYLTDRIGSIDVTPEQWDDIHSGATGDLRKVVITAANVHQNDSRAETRADMRATAARATGTGNTNDLSFFKNSKSNKDTDSTRISFFYFGDLIEIAAELIDDRRSRDKDTTPDTRILLGPVSFNVLGDDEVIETKYVNLANVPVALKSFEFWFNKNVVKRRINTWPLRSFIKSAVSELVLNALGEDSREDEGLRRSNQVGLYNLMMPGKGPGYAEHRIKPGDFDLDAIGQVEAYGSFPIGGPEKIKFRGYKHYLLVYGSTEALSRRDPTDVPQDFADGIYHFSIGADSGLVKTINFTKTDVPSLKESRLTSQDTEEGQLRDKYNATLELIGSSPLFAPGQKLYINPSLAGLGSVNSPNSVARQLGLGGYYDIVSVLSTIDTTGYRTTVEGVWTSFGKGEDEEQTSQAASPNDPDSSLLMSENPVRRPAHVGPTTPAPPPAVPIVPAPVVGPARALRVNDRMMRMQDVEAPHPVLLEAESEGYEGGIYYPDEASARAAATADRQELDPGNEFEGFDLPAPPDPPPVGPVRTPQE